MMKKLWPYFIFAVLTLAVMYPLYSRGFIFLLDMSFAPKLNLSDYIHNGILPPHLPILWFLKMLHFMLPMDVIQKIILSLLLFLPACFMFSLSKRYFSTPWATLAGIFYVFNPWVYERFLAGHWLLLIGYAVLPLFLKITLNLLEKPKKSTVLNFVLLFSLFPILSLHVWYLAAGLLLVLLLIYWIKNKKTLSRSFYKKFFQVTLITVLAFLVINSFWLWGFFKPASQFSVITQTDLAAFEVPSSSVGGNFLNALSLYGFWNHDYVLPKDVFSLWWVIALAIFCLSVIGAIMAIKQKNLLGLTFAILFFPVLFLMVGNATSITKPVANFFFISVPGFKGFRETAKFGSLLAFSYAFFVPFGAKYLTDWFKNKALWPTLSSKILYGMFFILPFASVPTIVNGFNHQITPTDYPASWYNAEELLKNDSSVSGVLVLPWWGYVRLPFAHNNLILNPAARFFSKPLIVSTKFENLSQASKPQSELDRAINNLVENKTPINNELGFLKSQNISHILLLEEQDSAKYDLLFQNQNLKRVLVTNDLALFKLP